MSFGPRSLSRNLATPRYRIGRPERHAIVHTCQHYDAEMSDILFEEFGVQDLNHMLGVGSGSNAVRTAPAMERVEPIAGAGGLFIRRLVTTLNMNSGAL